MRGTCGVVANRHRTVRPQEGGSGAPYLGEHVARALALDMEVFGGKGIGPSTANINLHGLDDNLRLTRIDIGDGESVCRDTTRVRNTVWSL